MLKIHQVHFYVFRLDYSNLSESDNTLCLPQFLVSGVVLDLSTSQAQIFWRVQSVSGRFSYVFCGKSEQESESSTCFPCKK